MYLTLVYATLVEHQNTFEHTEAVNYLFKYIGVFTKH